jgi:hypothetical protein
MPTGTPNPRTAGHGLDGAGCRGQHRRVEPASDGMIVIVRRTVRDAAGHVLHHDRWVSIHRPLDGLVLDGTG